VEFSLLAAGAGTVRSELIPAGTNGWFSMVCAAPFSQANIDGFQLSFVVKSGSGTARVYAAYIELNTRTDIWDAANAKMRANRSPNSGLSLASGAPIGTDIGPSVDLGGGRSLFYGGDAGMATAAGQQFWTGTNQANPSAPRATFVRNVALLLDSYDVEAATFSWFTGPSNTPYHPDDPTHGGRWPFKSFIHDGRLFTVGRFSTPPHHLVWIAYTDDFTGDPDTWTWTYLPAIPGFCHDRGNAEFGIWDDGAGTVYMWSHGPAAGANTVSLCRVDATAFHDGDWRRPEWWNGIGWSRDKSGIITPDPPGLIGRSKPRGRLYPPLDEDIGNQGSVHRRSADNKFQLTVIDGPIGSAAPIELRYALTSGTSPEAFGALSSKYVIPDGEAFVYGPAHHPQLTWTGMGANDQVWTYASNWGGSNRQWEPLYFTRFVKVTSVT
jgi:hypothetical protein